MGIKRKITSENTSKITIRSGLTGSSTLEAALLMPLILAVIFLILFFSVFVYTRTNFVRYGLAAVLRGSLAEQETSKSRVKIAENNLKKMVKEGFTDGVLYEESISGKGDELQVQIKLQQRLARNLLGGNHPFVKGFSSNLAFRARTCSPVSFIRTCRRLERLTKMQRNQK